MKLKTFEETTQFLYNLLPVYHIQGASALKPNLDNTLFLSRAFNNPHQKFKSIHVAGTNGKGSVCSMMASILMESGMKKVGLYTSPHLKRFNERIRINGKPADERWIVNFVNENLELIQQVHPSFFELTTVMAFLYFAENEVDIAVIETGLGGRLDCTNIITPILSIITNIGYDHTEFLGNTLEQIAFEKAGIIKPGVPVVVGPNLPIEVLEVFRKKATEYKSNIVISNYNKEHGATLPYINNTLYQSYNFSVVSTACSLLEIDSFSIKKGLANLVSNAGLRGRMEVINNNPLTILDVAHNKEGITEVLKQITIEYNPNKIHFVFGLVKEKNVRGILEIMPKESNYYFVAPASQRALPADELKLLAEEYGIFGESYSAIQEGFKAAQMNAEKDHLIIAMGSNFIIGELLPD